MFASTADELLRNFRAEVGDAVEPYLWEDWEAYGYMTEGLDALLKQANVQTTVMRLPFTADEPTVALPRSVLHIRTARIVGGGHVDPASAVDRPNALSNDYGVTSSASDPMFVGTGTPQKYVRDYERRALRLVPIPNTSGTLEVQATVTLSIPMEDGSPLPTVDAEDLRLILHYMKFLAYTKHEAETEDLVRSSHHEARFIAGARQREARLGNYRRPAPVIRPEYP